MPKPILIVQHTADCPPARVGSWLLEAGRRVELVYCQVGEEQPGSLSAYDGFVVLGGGMGAYDDATFPWLTRTKELLRAAVRDQVPTLAICLGHQLLGAACGGEVVRASRQQLGLMPVQLTRAGTSDLLFGPLGQASLAVHWNNDLVAETPPGSVILANSPAGVQAMRLGSSVWGLQFHPEVDVEILRQWALSDIASGRLSKETVAARLAEVAGADRMLRATWRAFVFRFCALV